MKGGDKTYPSKEVCSKRTEGEMNTSKRMFWSVTLLVLVCILFCGPQTKVANKGEMTITTSSEEARDHFITGRELYLKRYYDDAKAPLEKAVELDPDFALAYIWLARTYGQLDKPAERRAAYEKAYTHSENVSEQERIFIQAVYASFEGDQEKRHDLLLEMKEKFPELKQTHIQLASYYSITGEREK
jgi:tetratricopeptide (TPR) repeat protein